MKTVSKEIQDLSIKSLEVNFNKLSNAFKSMTKGSNTTIVKRQNAVRIGIEASKGILRMGRFLL